MTVALEQRQEWARLRALMLHPDRAWLVTLEDGERWLTDDYTLLRGTDSEALSGLPDGLYRLTAGKGPALSWLGHLAPTVGSLVHGLADESLRWLPVEPTLWTVAESAAKAMLVYATEGERRYPLMVNEEVWGAFHDQYDRNKKEHRTVLFEKDPDRPGRPFRVSVVTTYTDRDGEDIETYELLAYVMGISLPDGKRWGLYDARKVAQYIVDEAV